MPWYNDRESFNSSGLDFPYAPGSEKTHIATVLYNDNDRNVFNKINFESAYSPGSEQALRSLGYAPGRNPRDLVFDNTNTTCTSSANCWSGYTCSGGRCVKKEEADTTTGKGGGCNDPSPEICICRTPLCALERKCCSGTTYTRIVPRPGGGTITQIQCEPFQDPNQCDTYCDSYYQLFDELPDHCEMDSVCDCGNCMNGECRPGGIQPCYCKPKNEQCPKACEFCQNDGSCKEECNGCITVCSTQNNRCPCSNVYVNVVASVPACTGGPDQKSCATLRREKVAALCEKLTGGCQKADGKCNYHQYNGKTLDCECKTRRETCPSGGAVNKSYCAGFSEEGKTCYDRGNIFVPQEGSPSSCVPGTEVTLFGKVCEVDDQKDGCNGPPGCPDNKKCNKQTGFCEDDEDLTICTSGLVCQGNCCANGTACVPYRKFKVADNCHLQGGTFFAPQGGPSLEVTASIAEDDSICGRAHTHCDVVVNGQVIATHLECGNGLVNLGPAGFSGCPS